MNTYALSHLSDSALLQQLSTLVSRDRKLTAVLLAHLGEVESRKLYVPAGYPSMHAYCVHELRFSEFAALKRIRVARMARQHPAIFDAIADGRLHLSGALLLAPFVNSETVGSLLGAATHKTHRQIEALVAERYPRPDVPTVVRPVGPTCATLAARLVREAPVSLELATGPSAEQPAELAARLVEPAAGEAAELSARTADGPPSAGVPVPPARVKPLAPGRYSLQLTIPKSTHDKLRHAQELLGHAVPSGDVVQVLDRALDALITKLDKSKFAATDKPRPSRRTTPSNPRLIPAHVRRAVRERDGGRCTYLADSGRRCPARTRLEFDHVEPVARGGEATVEGIRLRCRAHNQFTAECEFGAEFMRHKREARREAAIATHAQA